MTSAQNHPISSARSVRRKAKARRSSSPRCNTQAMTLHLAEISAAVAPGAHAVLLLDQAGWHNSRALEIPDNITLLPIPPKCPELNPVENVCSSSATTGSRTGFSPPRSEERRVGREGV